MNTNADSSAAADSSARTTMNIITDSSAAADSSVREAMNTNTDSSAAADSSACASVHHQSYIVRPAYANEAGEYARLAHALWPDSDEAEHLEEGRAISASENDRVFFAVTGDSPAAIGFAHVSLRFDYVEGSDDSPTGYLEGIYVSPAARHLGVARALLYACESWARQKGASSFASDCELTNTISQNFHRAMGFTEANRIVCYIKPLTDGAQK